MKNVRRLFAGKWMIVCCALLALGLLLAAPEVAYAAPGGIIKAATKAPIVRFLLVVLAVIFLPVIVYYSVKSSLAVRKTRKDLAELARTHSQYSWLNINDRATEVFNWVWSAWTQGKMNEAKNHTTTWYWQNQQLQLDQWERDGLENVCQMRAIKGITPLFVQHNPHNNGEGSRMVISIRAEVVDYLREKSTGRIVRGDDKPGEMETVWTLMWVEGSWRLNLIEDGAREYTYLFLPNEVPAPAATVASAA